MNDIDTREPWSTTDYLLANVVDLLAGIAWQNANDPQAPKPVPLERPQPPVQEFSSIIDIKSLFGDIASVAKE